MTKIKSIKHDKKASKAALKYLEQIQENYEIIGSYNYDSVLDIFDFVALNDNSLVFIQIKRYNNCYPGSVPLKKISDKKRSRMETAAYRWLSWHDEYLDMFVRFDIIDVFVPETEDRALIRHYINASQ